MTGPLEQLADQWDEGLSGSPEETCAMRACAAQLREALRAQAEAGKSASAENAVLRDFLSAFADEDGCGCGYSNELLTAYRAAYDLVWPERVQADAGGAG